jgi:glycosyltransferase involved in cell wall biosynthesis
MAVLDFSFIIPVYNRPEEVAELLDSFCMLEGNKDFEIVIVEDGSDLDSRTVIESYPSLNISYYFKNNSGPGASRNFGMQRAKGNYFIILDSDCILPPNYLKVVKRFLNLSFADCFGGPDKAHENFSNIQKAIDFSMTSFWTTGGLRGRKNMLQNFQPRSFNMGISKKAFEFSGGFGKIHPGEDPDLSIRLKDFGYQITLIPDAYVYHKRRISFLSFSKQVYKFGVARSILNKWHPSTKSIFYWFPSAFSLGLLIGFILMFFQIYFLILLFALYFAVVVGSSFFKCLKFLVPILVIPAVLIQFFFYGFGFLYASVLLNLFKRDEYRSFPKLFFK